MLDEKVALKVGMRKSGNGFKFVGTVAQLQEALKLQEKVDNLNENEVNQLIQQKDEEN